MVVAFLHLTVGCTYYKIDNLTTNSETMSSEIDKFNKMGHYAIIHADDQLWHLEGLIINEDAQKLTGTVSPISSEHQYAKPRKKHSNRYKRNKQKPMNEIHFHLVSGFDSPMTGESVEIPFSQIKSISLNKGDGGTEFASILLGTVGVIVGVFLIILATKSSCPFVYVHNGEYYKFTGELYPGIITPNMQTDDYLPIPTNGASNELLIKVSNELKEIQHTDLLELLVVEHDPSQVVLLDQEGTPITFSELNDPVAAINNNQESELSVVTNKDDISFGFNTTTDQLENTRSLVLSFNNNDRAQNGNLFLRIKNSLWLDYAFGRFNAQFGEYYDTFQKNQQKSSKETSEKWALEQHIPLSVYVKSTNGWELIDRLNTVGPLAYRDIAVPLKNLPTSESNVEIKLETGFMFWELDYAGIDFSEHDKLEVTKAEMIHAEEHDGTIVTKQLQATDDVYLTQPNIGDEVYIRFDLPPIEDGRKQSLFLKNRGFYNYIRDYKGKPNFQKLKLFKEPGSFTEFSKLEYESLMNYADNDDLIVYHE